MSKTYNRALKQFNDNKLPEAWKTLQKITSAESSNVDAWQLRGMTAARMGRFDEAATCFRKIISLLPTSVEAHYYLGAALEAQHLYPSAIKEYEVTLKWQPSFFKAAYNLGNIYTAMGLLEKAEQYYRDALQHNPHYFEALNNLGSALKTLSKFDQALQCFHSALAIRPGDTSILVNIGNTYHLLEEYSQAERYYRDSIAKNGELPEAYCGLVGVLYKQGKLNEAQLLLGEAKRMLPHDSNLVASEAGILEKDGQYKQAYDCLKPHLGDNCESVDIANTFARVARHVDLADKAIELLEKLLKKNQRASDRMSMGFSLGELYDGIREYEKAFHYFSRANELKPYKLDRGMLVNALDKIMSVFSADFFASIETSGADTLRPVFVVGMPRSGTSLIEQILSSHPDVFGAGELMDIGMIAASMQTNPKPENNYPTIIPSLGTERLRQLADRYLNRINELAPDALRVVDKMPGNFLHLGLIELLLPSARVIHCLRDPLDNCLSCYFTDFLGYHPYAYNQADLGFYYCQHLRLMDHWKKVISLPIYTVQYEHLVADQESISRELVNFCGLEWDDRCLDFHKTKRLVKTASYDQVRRPMYKSAVGRSAPYRDKLGALLDELSKCHNGPL